MLTVNYQRKCLIFVFTALIFNGSFLYCLSTKNTVITKADNATDESGASLSTVLGPDSAKFKWLVFLFSITLRPFLHKHRSYGN